MREERGVRREEYRESRVLGEQEGRNVKSDFGNNACFQFPIDSLGGSASQDGHVCMCAVPDKQECAESRSHLCRCQQTVPHPEGGGRRKEQVRRE